MKKEVRPKYNDYGLTQWLWLVRHRENFVLGERYEIGAFCVFGAEHGIEIGDDVKIGYSSVLMTNSTIDHKKGKIVVKDGARIGANSTIMPGVTIGECATVGANSYVNVDVPDHTIWVGSPIRCIGRRTH